MSVCTTNPFFNRDFSVGTYSMTSSWEQPKYDAMSSKSLFLPAQLRSKIAVKITASLLFSSPRASAVPSSTAPISLPPSR